MMDVATKHQVSIAKKTLRMSDAVAMVMGGMTKPEAREVLRRQGWRCQVRRLVLIHRPNGASAWDYRHRTVKDARKVASELRRWHPYQGIKITVEMCDMARFEVPGFGVVARIQREEE